MGDKRVAVYMGLSVYESVFLLYEWLRCTAETSCRSKRKQNGTDSWAGIPRHQLCTRVYTILYILAPFHQSKPSLLQPTVHTRAGCQTTPIFYSPSDRRLLSDTSAPWQLGQSANAIF